MNDFPLFRGHHAACYAMLEINERGFVNSSTDGSTSQILPSLLSIVESVTVTVTLIITVRPTG